MKFVMTTLNEYLREKRVESGLSQLDVARELGYASPQFVSNWERGLVSPPLETVGILVELYKMKPNELIDRILEETRGYLEQNLAVKSKRRSKGGARKKSARRETLNA